MARVFLNATKVIAALGVIFIVEYVIYYILRESGYQNMSLIIILLILFGVVAALLILVPYMMYSWRSRE